MKEIRMGDKIDGNRFKTAIKRWFEILVYFFVASVILSLFANIFQLFGRLLIWEKSASLFLISTAFWYLMVQIGGFRTSHFKHIPLFIKYPPLWFGVMVLFIGTLMLLETHKSKDIIQMLVGVRLELYSVALGFIVGLYFSWHKWPEQYKRSGNPINRKIDSITDLLKDKKAFINWLNEETPINHQCKDLFHYELQAKKLSKVLQEHPAKSVGLVGQYGSGKSSMLNLTKTHLYEEKTNIVSTIGAWGFREGKAVELVLEHITEDIAHHIDILSIAALPKRYQSMLSECGNGIAKTIHGVFTPRKPIEILEKIDALLEKTNYRIIIFLEDLDRNLQQEILFEEVATLLDSIQHLERITFVLAIGNQHKTHHLLARLCEHIEIIPPQNKQEVIKIIEQFREWCMEEYPDMEYVPRNKMDRRFGANRGDAYQILLAIYDDLHPIDHAVLLLQTPRALKFALRRAWLTWSELHGEVDFDQMFLATILRESAAEAYFFVNKNINALRYVCGRNPQQNNTEKNKEDEKKRNVLNREWEAVTKDVDWDKDTVRKIVNDLFPGWDQKDSYTRAESLHEEMIQGFIKRKPTDYWQRFNRECLVEDEIRDQDVIREIKSWQNNHENKDYQSIGFAEVLYSKDGIAEKIEQFEILFSGKEIRELASQLFAVSLSDKGVESSENTCKGFVKLSHLSLRKQYSEHKDWLIKEIRKALEISLHFSNDLYHYWRCEDVYSKKDPTPELREQVITIFKDLFEDNPEKLSKILNFSNPWGLYHLVFLEREANTEDWIWLGEVLLSAGKVNPRLITSYVACLISDTDRIHDPDPEVDDYFKNNINYDRAKEIFGDNIKPLMELLCVEYKYPELADDYQYAQTRSVIDNAREEAKIWLKKELEKKQAKPLEKQRDKKKE